MGHVSRPRSVGRACPESSDPGMSRPGDMLMRARGHRVLPAAEEGPQVTPRWGNKVGVTRLGNKAGGNKAGGNKVGTNKVG